MARKGTARQAWSGVDGTGKERHSTAGVDGHGLDRSGGAQHGRHCTGNILLLTHEEKI